MFSHFLYVRSCPFLTPASRVSGGTGRRTLPKSELSHGRASKGHRFAARRCGEALPSPFPQGATGAQELLTPEGNLTYSSLEGDLSGSQDNDLPPSSEEGPHPGTCLSAASCNELPPSHCGQGGICVFCVLQVGQSTDPEG